MLRKPTCGFGTMTGLPLVSNSVAWPKPLTFPESRIAASVAVVNVGDAAVLLLRAGASLVGYDEAAHLYVYGGVPPAMVSESVAGALNPAGGVATSGVSTSGLFATRSGVLRLKLLPAITETLLIESSV